MSSGTVKILTKVFCSDIVITAEDLIEFCKMNGPTKTIQSGVRGEVFNVVNNHEKDMYEISQVFFDDLFHTYYTIPYSVSLLNASRQAVNLEKELSTMFSPALIFELIENYINNNIFSFTSAESTSLNVYKTSAMDINAWYSAKTEDKNVINFTVKFTNVTTGVQYSSTHQYVPAELTNRKSFIINRITVN